ncbi:hypothetical protein [Castellaniella sp.]|uniref:hypothetical protein n=1 Tax=Castellaniella sp. TaxID=1955812 RepID=UPI002AFE1C64|nr:hypothetical protein [Castellaniella sp.]
MNGRQFLIAMMMGSAPMLAVAEPTLPETPQVASLGAPVSDSALSEYRGARDITFNMQDTQGQLYQNQASNTYSGSNQVSDQALSGMNGFSTVIQNSGNNVLIQNSTIVNVKMQ